METAAGILLLFSVIGVICSEHLEEKENERQKNINKLAMIDDAQERARKGTDLLGSDYSKHDTQVEILTARHEIYTGGYYFNNEVTKVGE